MVGSSRNVIGVGDFRFFFGKKTIQCSCKVNITRPFCEETSSTCEDFSQMTAFLLTRSEL